MVKTHMFDKGAWKYQRGIFYEKMRSYFNVFGFCRAFVWSC